MASFSHWRLVLLLALWADTQEALREGFAKPDYAFYYRREALLKEVEEFVARHSSTMRIQLESRDASGYRAEVRVVTVTSNIGELETEHKNRVLLNFGQHGRELITSEVAMRLLRLLSADTIPVRQILSTTIFKIIPLENENGRKIVESGNLCDRRNGRGVDTNRNWDLNWGKKEKDYDPAEEYPGSKPFSEPETVILRDIAEAFKPHLWVNVHSGMQALFMPYDHKNTTPLGEAAHQMRLLLEQLNDLHCNRSCKVGSGGGSVGYLAHGTATDYMYDVLKVPVAFTFEIYGDLSSDADDCFRMFNPTTRDSFEDVVSRWSELFISLALNLTGVLSSIPNRSERSFTYRMNRKTTLFWELRRDRFLSGETSSLPLPLVATGLVLCYISYKLIKRLHRFRYNFWLLPPSWRWLRVQMLSASTPW